MDYLLSEVLDHLPNEERLLILVTSKERRRPAHSAAMAGSSFNVNYVISCSEV
jgi:hypothetical protein